MIAVEMMVARLEVGDTLVTVAGFIPIGLNSSAAGEFTFTLFVVIAVSLVVSWIVAVLFTPLLGVTLLPNSMKKHEGHKSVLARVFHVMLIGAARFKWITIALTLLTFGASIYGMKFVEQQFFPSSDRPELIVDWNLPQNASIHEGAAVPLAAVAKFGYSLEQPKIWRRSRPPTVTVQAAVAPLMLFIMATILMIQLQSFQRLFLVFAVASLALIGVVAALLPSRAPLGFVAILGVLALIGILIRNSVILIIQIEELRKKGRPPWEAVIEATEHRMRPILLTAAAATLALIPISRQIFWGPMAYAMMGGIVVGTVLTLLFLPALYIAWFRIKETKGAAAASTPTPLAE